MGDRLRDSHVAVWNDWIFGLSSDGDVEPGQEVEIGRTWTGMNFAVARIVIPREQETVFRVHRIILDHVIDGGVNDNPVTLKPIGVRVTIKNVGAVPMRFTAAISGAVMTLRRIEPPLPLPAPPE